MLEPYRRKSSKDSTLFLQGAMDETFTKVFAKFNEGNELYIRGRKSNKGADYFRKVLKIEKNVSKV